VGVADHLDHRRQFFGEREMKEKRKKKKERRRPDRTGLGGRALALLVPYSAQRAPARRGAPPLYLDGRQDRWCSIFRSIYEISFFMSLFMKKVFKKIKMKKLHSES
jgi:hypothetical protein